VRRNRIITDTAEPGSTFKIVVVSGALNDHVVKITDSFDCEHGQFWYAGTLLHDHDSQGVLTVEAVANAAHKLHDPALTTALAGFPVYPETALVGRLQSGQLEAGFFYAVEAASAKLRTVSLAPAYKYAQYTVTILNRAPNPRGAAALVRYLLAAQRSPRLRSSGLTANKPVFSGNVASIPQTLRRIVGATR